MICTECGEYTEDSLSCEVCHSDIEEDGIVFMAQYATEEGDWI